MGQSRGPARKLSSRDIVVLLAIAMAALFFGVRAVIRSSVVRPFAGHLSEYSDIPGLKSASAEVSDADLDGDHTLSFKPGAGASPAYVTGKVIPVNKGANKVDDLYFSLPKDFRATAPAEVGTVVWLDWRTESVGTYTDGAGAYQIACEATVIDKERALIVGKSTFHGSSPPSVKSRGGSCTGSKPTDEVVQYLTRLPSRSEMLAAERKHNTSFRLPAKPQPQGVSRSSGPRPEAVPPAPPQETRPELARPVPGLRVRPEASSPRQRPQASVELTGVVGFLAKPLALLEITEPGLGMAPSRVNVQEGHRVGSIEVLEINVQKRQVRIRNSGAEQCLSLRAAVSGNVAANSPAADQTASFATPPKYWPPAFGDLSGDLELRITNPNGFNVRVGLRSGGKGKDFIVSAYGTQSVSVPSGYYAIYFQYSHQPEAMYQGDSFTMKNNGVQITITKVVNGNYGIRKVN